MQLLNGEGVCSHWKRDKVQEGKRGKGETEQKQLRSREEPSAFWVRNTSSLWARSITISPRLPAFYACVDIAGVRKCYCSDSFNSSKVSAVQTPPERDPDAGQRKTN